VDTHLAPESAEGCFITSAILESTGKGDDAPELQKLRKFRDEVMKSDRYMSKDIETYYRIAPSVVEAIDENAKQG
jgi:hypothetical protein